MEKDKKDNTFKVNMPLLIVSIILFIIAFIIVKPLALRPILWIISITTIIANIVYNNRNFKKYILLLIILFVVTSLIFDYIVVVSLNRIPVFTYDVINTKNSRVYNGIGVRTWQCDKNNYKDLKTDPFYGSGYICDAKDIDVMDSNSFLNSVIENYDSYKDTYVKIKGKVSAKKGQTIVEMKPYAQNGITVNGYVNFLDNITLRSIFKESCDDLDLYDIYDEIVIVGIVKNLEEVDGKYVIYMYDTKIVSAMDLGDYEIVTTPEKKCTKEKNIVYENDKNKIYTYCIEDVFVSFKDNQYELSNALSSNKIETKDLLDNPKKVLIDEETNNKLYKFKHHNILVCNPETSKDIIIGDTKMDFKKVKCDIIEEEKVEE